MLNTEESRKGAMACLSAMKAIKELPYHKESEGTIYDYIDYLSSANNEILLAVGNQTEFVRGFISVLAEYFSAFEESDEFDWNPVALMTEDEKAAYLASYDVDITKQTSGDHHAN